jgi:hypothetical protein
VFMEMQFEVPERTHKQRLAALDKGNRIRSVRAQFKKDVKAGKRSVRAILLAEECPEDFATMRVVEMILPLPKVGRVKVRKMLNEARISPSKTLGGMTPRQRTELASWLVPYDNGVDEGGS